MFRVSDATAWAYCLRRAWFLLHPPPGEPAAPDPFDTLMQALGVRHERSVLDSLGAAVTAESVTHTRALIAERTPVIYQPQFEDAARAVVGIPDFLILEDSGYRVGDAKLSLSLEGKKAIKAQLGVYRELAGTALAGVVFLGNGETEEVTDTDRLIAQAFLDDMAVLAAQAERPDTHYAHTKCSSCPFEALCVPDFEAVDEVTLNPAVVAGARAGLAAQGIATVRELADREVDDVADVPYLKGGDKKRRAILQARSLTTGELYQDGDIRLPEGICVHFDVETEPVGRNDTGDVYLWGLLKPPHDESAFEYVWRSDEADGDRVAWLAFLDRVMALRDDFGAAFWLVHYSTYERTKIVQYAGRYGMDDDPTVQWLLSETGPLFDLFQIVRDHLILPVRSYSLKTVCRDPRLVDFQWQQVESGSQWSVVRYYDFLEADDPVEAEAIKNEILMYNFDDVQATAALWEWIDKTAFTRLEFAPVV